MIALFTVRGSKALESLGHLLNRAGPVGIDSAGSGQVIGEHLGGDDGGDRGNPLGDGGDRNQMVGGQVRVVG